MTTQKGSRKLQFLVGFSPEMTHQQKVEKLIETLEKQGIKVRGRSNGHNFSKSPDTPSSRHSQTTKEG